MLVKTDVQGFVKDTNSGAVLSVDNEKLAAYKTQKKIFENRHQDHERLNRLENDISEIKKMLQALLRETDK